MGKKLKHDAKRRKAPKGYLNMKKRSWREAEIMKIERGESYGWKVSFVFVDGGKRSKQADCRGVFFAIAPSLDKKVVEEAIKEEVDAKQNRDASLAIKSLVGKRFLLQGCGA